jgi:hypothetical protein
LVLSFLTFQFSSASQTQEAHPKLAADGKVEDLFSEASGYFGSGQSGSQVYSPKEVKSYLGAALNFPAQRRIQMVPDREFLQLYLRLHTHPHVG